MSLELLTQLEIKRDILSLSEILMSIMNELYSSNGVSYNDERSRCQKIINKSEMYLDQFKDKK